MLVIESASNCQINICSIKMYAIIIKLFKSAKCYGLTLDEHLNWQNT